MFGAATLPQRPPSPSHWPPAPLRPQTKSASRYLIPPLISPSKRPNSFGNISMAYLPLRRAANDSQVYLGRTFLQ